MFALPLLLATVNPRGLVKRVAADKVYTVAIVGRKSQPHHESIWNVSDSTHLILPFDTRNGRRILHVLYIMEPLPDIAQRVWHRPDNLLERKQSVAGSPRTKIGRASVSTRRYIH